MAVVAYILLLQLNQPQLIVLQESPLIELFEVHRPATFGGDFLDLGQIKFILVMCGEPWFKAFLLNSCLLLCYIIGSFLA